MGDERYCPVRATMEVLGQKWILHILLAIMQGARRFNEIQAASGGVNPRTLSDRLKALEAQGILRREVVATIPPWVEYTLTEQGQDLSKVILSIEQWGRRWMKQPRGRACRL